MLRLATAIVWILGSLLTFWASIEMISAGADLFTVAVIISVAMVGGAIPATLFYGICRALFGPRAPAPARVSPAPASSSSYPPPKGLEGFLYSRLGWVSDWLWMRRVANITYRQRKERARRMDAQEKLEREEFSRLWRAARAA